MTMQRLALASLILFSPLAFAQSQGFRVQCFSRHGTGSFRFDPVNHRGELYLNGHGNFQEEFPVQLKMDCQYSNIHRPHWECAEAGNGVHPDGAHRVGIDISYGNYLPVAFRDSKKFAAAIVVDDFGCRETFF